MVKRKPEIIISKTGPYVAVDVEEMAYCDGEKIETKPVMMLCRCGETLSEPFCDGSHAAAGFAPTEGSDEEPVIKRYRGHDLVITFNPCLCSHSGVCVMDLPTVFNKKNRPWIQADGASLSEIVDVIDRCPSGALSYVVAGHPCECQNRPAAIFVERQGPYNVEGSILIKDEKHSEPYNKEHYCLCRCGKSLRAPYCDGSHRERERGDDLENW